MKSNSGQLEGAMALMQAHLATMSPEQRSAMEAMLARNGVEMPNAGPNGAMAVKMCMTREMAARKQVPLPQSGNCRHTQAPMAGNMVKLAFTCTRPEARGEGQVNFLSDTSYSVKMRVTSAVTGSAETMNMDATGKWTSADCGSIAPTGHGQAN
ncbi:MAG: DUF3617 domain-containing protein [Telluria sp.]